MERKECRCGQLRIANTDDGRVLQWENYQKYWVIIDMEPAQSRVCFRCHEEQPTFAAYIAHVRRCRGRVPGAE